MKISRLLLASAMAVMLTSAARSTVLIDDFATGSVSLRLGAAPEGQSVSSTQAGAMASGHRNLSVGLFGPAALGGSLDIASGRLSFRQDPGVHHRIDMFYGATYSGHDHPMQLNLSGEDRLRFSFADAPLGLNFNVLLYYRGEIDNYSQVGLNIAPNAGAFDVEMRFADFAAQIAIPSRPADFSHVSGITIVTQSGAYVGTGGEGFSLMSISSVPEPPSALLLGLGLGLAGVTTVAFRRRRAPAVTLLRAAALGAGLGAGLLGMLGSPAMAAPPPTTVSWVAATGSALNNAPIDLWLRLSVDAQATTPLILDGVTSPLDLGTELPGWTRIDFIDTQSWLACGNSFMPGNCSDPDAPYGFEANTGANAFGVYVNGHTLPLNLILQPGQSHDFLIGSFVPQNGPVAPGTYTLDNAGLQLLLTGVDAAGATVYAYVGLGSACDGSPTCTLFTRDVVAVPEPATWLLILLGAGGVAWRCWSERRASL